MISLIIYIVSHKLCQFNLYLGLLLILGSLYPLTLLTTLIEFLNGKYVKLSNSN